ncbi:ABC transporter permease [Fusobacterium nucleatum]|jgi:ABC transporter, permease protein|uniref:ABC transporter permease n=1 Tax=Fusobacterium nucleatum TaxID=851 RepID=UPI00355B6432
MRYFKILYAYLRGSLMQQMEYKFNFIIGGTFELVWMGMYLIFINIIFLHTNSINGWNKYETLMLTFQGGLMDSIFTFLIVPGLKRLPTFINTGELDFVLLKPLNKRFNLCFSEFDIPQIKNIFINIIGLVYCLKKLKIDLNFNKMCMYILLSVNGFLMIYSIIFILMCFSFWVIRMDIVMGLGSEMIGIGNKPISIYPRMVQKFLTYILPLLICFNFPVLYILKGLNKYYITYSMVATGIAYFISNFIFQRGLKKYVSAGS